MTGTEVFLAALCAGLAVTLALLVTSGLRASRRADEAAAKLRAALRRGGPR